MQVYEYVLCVMTQVCDTLRSALLGVLRLQGETLSLDSLRVTRERVSPSLLCLSLSLMVKQGREGETLSLVVLGVLRLKGQTLSFVVLGLLRL